MPLLLIFIVREGQLVDHSPTIPSTTFWAIS